MLSFGLSQYNQAGVGLNYQGAGGTGAVGAVLNSVGPKVSLDIDALVFLGRYALSENYSFMLGMKNSTIKDATADIFKTAGATTAASITGKTASSSVVAIAYEQPDIALRVEYLYEADVSFSLDTTGGLNASTGTTQGSLPDYQTINFQTGIAADTLAFGSIRMADWKNHQLAVAPQTLQEPVYLAVLRQVFQTRQRTAWASVEKSLTICRSLCQQIGRTGPNRQEHRFCHQPTGTMDIALGPSTIWII
jgi:hypothetical protein